MLIEVYADTTPWDVWSEDGDNCVRVDIPETIVSNYYKTLLKGNDFINWYKNMYTLDDTEGLYQFARDNNIYPRLICHPTIGREVSVEELAMLYAEKYGIIEYHIENGKMVYYSSFPMEHSSIKATVDLNTWEEKRIPLKKYYVAYKSKIGGKYTANYCA